MSESGHERAREMVALLGGDGLQGDLSDRSGKDDQSWLRVHLQECTACREYAEAAGQAVGALQSEVFAPDFALVRATQMRLHARAMELRRRRERVWLMCLACFVVGLSAAITTPVLWRAFAWAGAAAGISSSIWQAGFAFLWIAPALVAGTILLARDTHLNHNLEMQLR
jgi:predicted anti-sigma-YlaC factor YlaD